MAALRWAVLLALLQACGESVSAKVDARSPDMEEQVLVDAGVDAPPDAPPDAPTSLAVSGEMTTIGQALSGGTLRVEGSLTTTTGGCTGTTCVHGQVIP